ncbi:hypothetical protein [Streptomyces sp. 3N207]|uniref:hypothetical protein n=1 Tax=Streptomyces sp. 3N207 TaxID=3457417 RepID=UPI003FD3B7C0
MRRRLGDEPLNAGARFDVRGAGLTVDTDNGHPPGGDQQAALDTCLQKVRHTDR